MIEKGYISAILDGGKKVTVVPAFSGDVVSHELTVPFFLIGGLAINTEVVYCSFPDNTGTVLARIDGEWNRALTGPVSVDGINIASHTHTDSMGGGTSKPK